MLAKKQKIQLLAIKFAFEITCATRVDIFLEALIIASRSPVAANAESCAINCAIS